VSAEASCALCRADDEPALHADARWRVRHIEPPWGIAGWMVLIARRHAASPGELDDAQAASLGPILRRCHRALAAATGAPRIYVAALGELVPHLPGHRVPRFDDGPRGFALFDRQRAAQAGELAVDPAEVARISAAFAAAMRGG
jgi:diadenosine tetraphosphate (Ap4A) HIT family hydrolase